jgi:chromosome segregation ATPase
MNTTTTSAAHHPRTPPSSKTTTNGVATHSYREGNSLLSSSFASSNGNVSLLNTSLGGSSAIITQQSALLEDIHEKQKLEKLIFELKMKIYYLEEQLHVFHEKELSSQLTDSHINNEINDLKLQLEEKSIECEERNLLLMKAKNAMEIMKKEILSKSLDATKQEELEEKMKSLREMNEEIEKEYRNAIVENENEIKSLKQSLTFKQQEVTLLEDQIVSLLLFLSFPCFFSFFVEKS